MSSDKNESDYFAQAVLLLENEQEVFEFFSDLITKNEYEELKRRYWIARLLAENKTFREIEKETGASSRTISRVNKTLREGKGYKIVFEKIKAGFNHEKNS